MLDRIRATASNLQFVALVLAGGMLCSSFALTADENQFDTADMVHTERIIQLRAAIEAQEAPGDSWRPEIAESLLALGQALQAAGEHAEALTELERSVHISRINHGLFSQQQLPAILLQVDSHLALEQWDDADSLRQYAFYVQSRAARDADPSLIPALIDYAGWQLEAFAQRRGVMPAARLLDAYQLYAVALSIVDQHDSTLEYPTEQYLHQLAYISWLMHRTRALNRSELVYSDERRVDDMWAESLISQKYKTRSSAAMRGQYALEEIIAIRAGHMESAPAGTAARAELARQYAEAVLDLGDWHLLLDRRQQSAAVYRQAWNIIAEESPAATEDIFEKVVLIPSFERRITTSEPRPSGQAPQSATAFAPQYVQAEAADVSAETALRRQRAYVTMEFDINRFGRAMNVSIVETSPPDENVMSRRLVSALRDSRLRPRIRDGQPTQVTGLVYRFPYEIERQVAQTQ
jgi:tetratricopeptide (TPR) repeat protein